MYENRKTICYYCCVIIFDFHYVTKNILYISFEALKIFALPLHYFANMIRGGVM